MMLSARKLPSYSSSKDLPATILDFKNLIKPQNSLESELLNQPEFKLGLNWGVPRFGHPEGKVGFHIVEVLENIAELDIHSPSYMRLRLVAIAHDTFKYLEAETIAQGKRINHGLLARKFMEDFVDDEVVLDLIELHDEIYYAWRHEALHEDPGKASMRLQTLMDRIEENLMLHYLFFCCDTQTGDKIQAPRVWFERKIATMNLEGFEELFTRNM